MGRKASTKRWRRESAADVALDILRGYFGLNAAALAFLIEQTDQPPEVRAAAKTLGLPLLGDVDAVSLSNLRLAYLVERSSEELTPRGVHTADKVGELAVLLNCCMDDYYLPADVLMELRTLKRVLKPGADIHRAVWGQKETLPIVTGSVWADRLGPPELDFGLWKG